MSPGPRTGGDGIISTCRSFLTRPVLPARARQIELHLALLPVYAWLLFSWTAYAVDISAPGRRDRAGHIKGHDFVHFYVLGQIALERRPAELYSFADQAVRTDRLAGYEDRFLPVYGPQVSIFFAPFAWMPYGAAFTSWALLSVATYALCCYALWTAYPALRKQRWAVLVLAAAYPPIGSLIAFGHISAIALACVATAYFALRARRPWLAGLAFGLLFYKPSLGLVLPVVLVWGREWKVIAGAVAAVLIQAIVVWAYYGNDTLLQYWQAVSHLGDVATILEPHPEQMHSLRSFMLMLLPSPALARACYLLAAVALVSAAAVCWKTAAPIELRYSVMLLSSVLVDPHVNAYDLVVIAPVFILVAGWAVTENRATSWLWILLYLCYYLPALAFLSKVTHIQASVPALVALTVLLARWTRAADLESRGHERGGRLVGLPFAANTLPSAGQR